MSTELSIQQTRSLGVFSDIKSFEESFRIGRALSSSDLVPKTYKNNVPNCLVAMEMSQRTGAGIMAVMQNLHIIQGRPSWSSSFIIAALNSCGRFSPLRFETEQLQEKTVSYDYWAGQGENRKKNTSSVKIKDMRCRAWCYEAGTKDKLYSPWVSMEMAVKEGWYTKPDSKWQTMPELMIQYRAAAFFGRLYAPDVLMGMKTDDEVYDISPVERDITPSVEIVAEEEKPETVADINSEIRNKKQKPKKNPETVESSAAEEPPPIDLDIADDTAGHDSISDSESSGGEEWLED